MPQVLVDESAADRLNPALPVTDDVAPTEKREVSVNDIAPEVLAEATQKKIEHYEERAAEKSEKSEDDSEEKKTPEVQVRKPAAEITTSGIDKNQTAVLEPAASRVVTNPTKK